MDQWRRRLITFILLTGGIKTALTFTVIVPALQMIAAAFAGRSDPVLSAQLVLAAAPAGMAAGGLFAGWIVAAAGLRRALNIGLAVCTLCGLAPLLIEGYALLIASRVLLGLSVVTVDIALTTILAAQFAGAARSRLIGFRSGIASIGTVATLLIAGQLAQSWGWRAPSWLFLIPGAMLMLSLTAFDRPIAAAPEPQSAERFSMLQLWPIYALQLLTSIFHTMPSFQMPFLLNDFGITDARQVSLVPSVASAFSILGAFLFASVYLRAGRWTLVFACLLMGAGFVGVGVSASYAMILLFVMVEGFGSGWTMPYLSNRLLDRVTPLQRAQAMGFLSTSLFLGHLANPIVTKPIRDNLGIHSTFWAVGGGVLLFAASLALWTMATRRREVPV